MTKIDRVGDKDAIIVALEKQANEAYAIIKQEQERANSLQATLTQREELYCQRAQQAAAALRPATKYLSISPEQQFAHIESEVCEAKSELFLYRWNGKTELLAMELVDIQMSCETMLAILGLTEEERSEVRQRVIEKNRSRGYYD